MNISPSSRDNETISAYLDGQLAQDQRARLEARFKDEPELRALLLEMSKLRALVRSLPARKAPRNFMLKPEMVGVKPPPPRTFPAFRLAFALASVLFFATFITNFSLPFAGMNAPAQPAAMAVEMSAPDSPTESGMPQTMLGGGAGMTQMPGVAPELAATASPTGPTPPNVGFGGGPGPTETPEAPPGMSLKALPPTQAADNLPQETPTTQETPSEQAPLAMAQPAPGEPAASAAALPVQPRSLPVPAFVQFGLLSLAVIIGGTTFLQKYRRDSNWMKKYAVHSAGLSRANIIFLVLLLVLALVFALGIFYFSSLAQG